ncbi:MAG: 2-oxoacid:acceptor oxidoreductase subunit alpha [Azospirillum sp.]|nr:2-oxoacid:acceptor oxidoreductase subunit alpha [Azospirillum sp.]
MTIDSVAIALVGSGGAGVMTAGEMLLEAAGRAGWFGQMTRSSGPQIRGGEAAAFVRLSTRPVEAACDRFDLLVALDWGNVVRFVDELPLSPTSTIITDPDQDEVPAQIAASGARTIALPIKAMAEEFAGGRVNMVALGAVATTTGLPRDFLKAVIAGAIGHKGEGAMAAAAACIESGATAAATWELGLTLPAAKRGDVPRWNISGNEAAGLGALRGGVRFCAAYPITPATEVLEWLAPNLAKTGGVLVQAEDELASINMCLGGSFGGVPSVTATSGPGLSLMTEAIGLGVSSETPVVIIDVMRGGPSTGIPTKSEQSDLNIALYGLHGDAPHLVVAPTSIADCLFATQWAVHLAEAMQCPAIVLSDQNLGQTRGLVDRPEDPGLRAARSTFVPAAAGTEAAPYKRYAVTASGVSPMAIPGQAGGEYVADGLEHVESGVPSAQAGPHRIQLDKRAAKLTQFDYGDAWADVEGDGPVAVITWGSSTGPAREAVARLAARGNKVRLIAIRLLSPVRPAALAVALDGVVRVLVVEQSHQSQFHKYLRAHYDLPGTVHVFSRPGPLPIRPSEVLGRLERLL